MHYQLFIPQTDEPLGTPQQALERLGLADLVAGHEGIPKTGPEEKRGILFCWRKTATPDSFSYTPEKQTWIPAAGGPNGEEKARYWVGFWNEDPVQPDELKRNYAHAGKTVTLGDGNVWRFPKLSELPKDLILADDGSWKFQLQREYHDLWMEASDWLKQILDSPSLDFADLADFCVRCLKQNYRLLPEVVSHLRLFTTRNIEESVAALLDLEVAE